MSPHGDEVLQSALDRPITERVRSIETLLANLKESNATLSDEKRIEELDRRLDELLSGREPGIPWSEFHDE